MGSGSSSPPAESAEQKAANQSVTETNNYALDRAKQQNAFSDALMPYQLKSMHLQMVDPMDPSKGFTDVPLTAEEQQGKDITAASNAQILAGLNGTLPVGDAATNDWQQTENQLRSQLAAQFGPGWESSTGGARALAEFNRQKTSTFDAVRSGKMTTADAIGTNAQLRVLDKTSKSLGQSQSLTNPLAQGAASLLSVGSNFQNQANSYENQRQYSGNYGLNVNQQQNQLIGSGVQGLASAGMMGAVIV